MVAQDCTLSKITALSSLLIDLRNMHILYSPMQPDIFGNEGFMSVFYSICLTIPISHINDPTPPTSH